jgi:hypothetical protein
MAADGNLPTRGQRADTVRAGLNYVLSQADESGLIARPGSAVPMYGHGFATLFLAEIYGETDRPHEVRDAVQRAVRLIAAAQNAEGGWRYFPVPGEADVSVTTCQLMALRAVRDAGLAVPADTIARATNYLRSLQNPDGGFRYQSGGGQSAFARSAAAVATLQMLRVAAEADIQRGLDYVVRTPPRREYTPAYYFYGHYYAALSLYQAGGVRWQQWWPAICRDLLGRQHRAGDWGDEYTTAMALLVLQTPKRLLTIVEPGPATKPTDDQ